MKNFFFLLMLLVGLAACEEVYDIPPQSFAQVNFYDMDELTATSPLLTIKGVDVDSVWLESTYASSYLLPLGNTGQNTFALLIDSVADTLQINYNFETEYESMETGFYYTYNITSIASTRAKIDSIALIDTIANDITHENIQIFLNDSTNFTSTDE